MSSDQVHALQSIRPCRYRYQIRERLFTLNNRFEIKDEIGREKYVVRSKRWTLSRKLVLEDINGNALLKIHQKGFRFLDQFNILSARDGDTDRQIASIRQKFTVFKHSYKIYSIYGEYKMKGLDVFDHAFTLKNKDDKTIAIVNKKFFSMADTYGVEIIDTNNDKEQEDHAFILALIIVLHCSLYYRQLAIVKKKFSFIHPKFDIESIYGQYSIEGIDIFAHLFVLTKQGRIVATISKAFFSLADTYGVEIATNEDQAFILAVVIVIDQVLYDNNGSHHHHHFNN